MLTRISLFVAIIATLAVGVVNFVFVKEKINVLVTDRNTQRDGRIAAEGQRDAAKKELASTKKELAQTQQDLATAKNEREKAVAAAAAAAKRADELTEKVAKVTQERDLAQADLAAYKATGITAEQVGKLTHQIKTLQETIDTINEEKLVLQRAKSRVEARLAIYEGTNKVVTLRPDLHGKILVVDPKWDFVVLNIGQDQGLMDNGELLVSRQGKLVAKVIVRSMERNRSIANIMPGWKLGEVIEGDEVTPAHPAS